MVISINIYSFSSSFHYRLLLRIGSYMWLDQPSHFRSSKNKLVYFYHILKWPRKHKDHFSSLDVRLNAQWDKEEARDREAERERIQKILQTVCALETNKRIGLPQATGLAPREMGAGRELEQTLRSKQVFILTSLYSVLLRMNDSLCRRWESQLIKDHCHGDFEWPTVIL